MARHLKKLLFDKSGSVRIPMLLALGGICMLGVAITVWAIDTDNDGMDDLYEELFGLNPFDASDASQNHDTDGWVNSNEYVAATDPFVSDTDRDGWNDDLDNVPVSRLFLEFGNPQFTNGIYHEYTGPAWWLDAAQYRGDWITNPPAWFVSTSNKLVNVYLDIRVDRNILTNDLRLGLHYFDHTNSVLELDLVDAIDKTLATDLLGNLMSGTGTNVYDVLSVPMTTYAGATKIRLRWDSGDVTIYSASLYIDDDGDALDADQENQLGSSDQSADSDGDGLNDYDEAFTHGTDPADADTDSDGINDGEEVASGASPTNWNLYVLLPFVENFETNTVALGDLANQNNWVVDKPGAAIVQTNVVYEGEQALELSVPTGNVATISHILTAPNATNVWLDQYVRVPYTTAPEILPDTGSALFLFDKLQLLAHDGTQSNGQEWLSFTNQPAVMADEWVRVSVKLDYSQQTWDIYIAGKLVAEGLGFASAQSAITQYELSGRVGFSDQITVSTNEPSGLGLDGDNLPDDWELVYFGDLDEVDDGDPDYDGLVNLQEYLAGTDPTNPDSDGDYVYDGDEVITYGTSPVNPDTDGDGMPDYELFYGLDPLVDDASGDLDGDGLTNIEEITLGSYPDDPDTDNDGVNDGMEYEYGADVFVSNSYANLPFTENFEQLSLGELSGQGGWLASQTNIAVVEDFILPWPEGSRALQIGQGAYPRAYHLFNDGGASEVWSEYYMAPLFVSPETIPVAPVNGTATFLALDQDKIAVYDGTTDTWITNSVPLLQTFFNRVTIKYSNDAKTWSLWINGVQYADELGYADSSARFNAVDFTAFPNSYRYIDDVRVSTNMPEYLQVTRDDFLLSGYAPNGTANFQVRDASVTGWSLDGGAISNFSGTTLALNNVSVGANHTIEFFGPGGTSIATRTWYHAADTEMVLISERTAVTNDYNDPIQDIVIPDVFFREGWDQAYLIGGASKYGNNWSVTPAVLGPTLNDGIYHRSLLDPASDFTEKSEYPGVIDVSAAITNPGTNDLVLRGFSTIYSDQLFLTENIYFYLWQPSLDILYYEDSLGSYQSVSNAPCTILVPQTPVLFSSERGRLDMAYARELSVHNPVTNRTISTFEGLAGLYPFTGGGITNELWISATNTSAEFHVLATAGITNALSNTVITVRTPDEELIGEASNITVVSVDVSSGGLRFPFYGQPFDVQLSPHVPGSTLLVYAETLSGTEVIYDGVVTGSTMTLTWDWDPSYADNTEPFMLVAEYTFNNSCGQESVTYDWAELECVSGSQYIFAGGKVDLDGDSDNTWTDALTPSEPSTNVFQREHEDSIEDGATFGENGIAVGYAYFDSDNDGVLDKDESELLTTSEDEGRIAVMAILSLYADELSHVECFDTTGITATVSVSWEGAPGGGDIRLFDFDTYDPISNGAVVFSGMMNSQTNISDDSPVPYRQTQFLVEGLELGQVTVLVNCVVYDSVNDTEYLFGKDEVLVSVYGVPKPLALTDYFTPAQIEAPPYHVAKFDYEMFGGQTNGSLSLMVGGTKWDDDLFYRYAITNKITTIAPDTTVYSQVKRYSVPDLYDGYYTPAGSIERIVWDGRRHTNASNVAGYPAIMIDSNGVPDYALRKVSGGHYQYPALIAHVIGDRPLARAVKYISEGDSDVSNANQLDLEFQTTPLPISADGIGKFGRPPYFGFFRDMIHSGNRSLSLTCGRGMNILKGVGPPLGFTAYHNGNSWRHTSLGFGWVHNWDLRVVQNETNIYLMWESDHMLSSTNYDANGIFAGDIWIYGEKARLEKSSDRLGYDEWRLTLRDRTEYFFTTNSGQLAHVEDRNGNTLSIALEDYPGSPPDIHAQRIKTISSSVLTGTELEFIYDTSGSLIEAVTLGGRSLELDYYSVASNVYGSAYEADEVISGVSGVEYDVALGVGEGRRRDPASRLIVGSITNVSYAHPIDASQKVINHVLSYLVDEDVNTLVSEAEVAESYIGTPSVNWQNTLYYLFPNTANYNETSEGHVYDPLGRLIATSWLKDGHSGQVTWTYDDQSRRVSFSDGLVSVSNEYDSVGNLTKSIYGNQYTNAYEYDATWNVVSSFTDGRGYQTTYAVDGANGDVLSKTENGDAGSRTWDYIYNGDGTVLGVTDPLGTAITYGYDDGGKMALITQGGVTNLDVTHDVFGNVLSSRDGEGNESFYEYDNWNRQKAVTPPRGISGRSEYVYSALDQLVKYKRPQENAPSQGTVNYLFDVSGRPTGEQETVAFTDGPNKTFLTLYATDSEGNVTNSTTDGKYTVEYTYDYLERRISERVGDPSSTNQSLLWSKVFHVGGELASSTDGNGNATSYAYDNAARVTTVTYPSYSVQYEYDRNGNVLAERQVGSSLTITNLYEYDAYNRQTNHLDPRGVSSKTEYNDADLVVSTTDGRSNVTTYAYSDAYFLTNTFLPDGSKRGMTRDGNGLTRSLVDEGTNTTTYSYSPENFLEIVTSPDGGKWGGSKGADGRSLTTVYGSRTNSLSHNSDGSVGKVQQPGSIGPIVSEYDGGGLLAVAHPDGRKTEYARGADWRVETVTQDSAGANSITSQFAYAENGELVGSAVLKTSSESIDRSVTSSLNNLNQVTNSVTGGGYSNQIIRGSFGEILQVENGAVGTVSYLYDSALVRTGYVANGRAYSTKYDANYNPVLSKLPSGTEIDRVFNSRDSVTLRTTTLNPGGGDENERYEILNRDSRQNVYEHWIYNPNADAYRLTTYSYDANSRVTGITCDGLTRSFQYDVDGQVTNFSIGSNSAGWLLNERGLTAAMTVDGLGYGFAYAYDSDDRLESVDRDGIRIYDYLYDSAGRLTNVIDKAHLAYGGANTISREPDAIGYATARRLPFGALLTRPVNDVEAVTSSELVVSGMTNEVSYALQDFVYPTNLTRPGAVPDCTIELNASKEIISIVDADMGVALGRDPASGFITGRTLSHVGATDSYTHNQAGWIESEQRDDGSFDAAYQYDSDGLVYESTINGIKTHFVRTDGGALTAVSNVVRGSHLHAGYEGRVWEVGSGIGMYTNVEAALTSMVADLGPTSFSESQVIVLMDPVYTNDVFLDPNVVGALSPTTNFPLIIRSPINQMTVIQDSRVFVHYDNVRIQGLFFEGTNTAGITIGSVDGASVVSCVVRTGVKVATANDLSIIGNTFDFSVTTIGLGTGNGTNAQFRNNIVLNDGVDVGLAWDFNYPTNSHNIYFPTNGGIAVGTNNASAVIDPLLDPVTYRPALNSPAVGAGLGFPEYAIDVLGKHRRSIAPTIGAHEIVSEQFVVNDCRVTSRDMGGRVRNYSYDVLGRLVAYDDVSDPDNSATYDYDHLGRRTLMTVGSGASQVITRMIYDGNDVVAEYKYEGGSLVNRRLYWLDKAIDRRIGFVDIDSNNVASLYWYATDQVGSVIQVMDEFGGVVCQYDYDAFGNIHHANTFETVENRYRFHGREYDEHRGDYYVRNRIYDPCLGMFLGFDMNRSLGPVGEALGEGSWVAFNNNPMLYTDPFGLAPGDWWDPRTYKTFHKHFGDETVALGKRFGKGIKEGGLIGSDMIGYGYAAVSDRTWSWVPLIGRVEGASQRENFQGKSELYQTLYVDPHAMGSVEEVEGNIVKGTAKEVFNVGTLGFYKMGKAYGEAADTGNWDEAQDRSLQAVFLTSIVKSQPGINQAKVYTPKEYSAAVAAAKEAAAGAASQTVNTGKNAPGLKEVHAALGGGRTKTLTWPGKVGAKATGLIKYIRNGPRLHIVWYEAFVEKAGVGANMLRQLLTGKNAPTIVTAKLVDANAVSSASQIMTQTHLGRNMAALGYRLQSYNSAQKVAVFVK